VGDPQWVEPISARSARAACRPPAHHPGRAVAGRGPQRRTHLDAASLAACCPGTRAPCI